MAHACPICGVFTKKALVPNPMIPMGEVHHCKKATLSGIDGANKRAENGTQTTEFWRTLSSRLQEAEDMKRMDLDPAPLDEALVWRDETQ